jgi:hypothetical protein
LIDWFAPLDFIFFSSLFWKLLKIRRQTYKTFFFPADATAIRVRRWKTFSTPAKTLGATLLGLASSLARTGLLCQNLSGEEKSFIWSTLLLSSLSLVGKQKFESGATLIDAESIAVIDVVVVSEVGIF